ncbi:MAG: hypothetical protein NVS3B20_05810 [Polyangiales bacterium]
MVFVLALSPLLAVLESPARAVPNDASTTGAQASASASDSVVVAGEAAPSGSASASASVTSASASTLPKPPKSDKAKAVEKEAALTPIVPSPTDVTKPAFQLYGEVDIPILAMGIVISSARVLRTQKAFCGHSGVPACDPAELNALDRNAAGLWRPGWATISDVGFGVIAVGAAAILTLDEGPLPALNDAVVIAQAALLASAGPTLLTIAAARPRPFLYGDAAPEDKRNSPDAALSFISSHTSVSFAVATSLFMAERRLHPKSPWGWALLGVSLAGASTVGMARVLSGNHFPTDAIAGAVIGCAMGVLVPALHDTPVRIVPQIGPDNKVVSVITRF